MMWKFDQRTVTDDFLRTTARIAPEHRALARRTLERVPSERWTLEWFLPDWLGGAFGLEEKHAREFVLSNVLGLASIRLQDDLADDEVSAEERTAVVALAAALQNAALEIYRSHFDAAADFWGEAEALMQEWRGATICVNRRAIQDIAILRDLSNEQTRTLTRLGSPLKIGAFAVCLLTGHEQALSSLYALLDHALIAAVLHDHAADWERDLAAGRWNLFVAALSPLSQTRAHQNQNHARMVQAWMDSVAPREYFTHIAFHVRRARSLSTRFKIAPLTAHLDCFLTAIWQTHDSSARFYHEQLAQAAAKLFGAAYQPPVARAWDTSKARQRKEAARN